jgi:tetratricopeptide (TPR) repeat protein
MGSRRSALLLPVLTILAMLSAAQTVRPRKPAGPPQSAPARSARPDDLQQHYDAARTFEIGGDQEKAVSEYQIFIAEALRRIGNARARAKDFDHASQAFDQAIAFRGDDANLHLDYATSLLLAGKLPESQAQAEQALKLSPENPQVHTVLGRVLFEQGEYEKAKPHLEAAVVASPKFDIGYILGLTYIKLGDLTRVSVLFDEMATGLGDSASLRIMYARAYRQGEYFDQTLAELKKALAKDPKALSVHLLMGLSYLDRDSEGGFAEALPEFQAELKNNPNDFRSHYMLGYIAMKQHREADAERELKRSAELDPQNPEPLAYLGQMYADANRLPEAEAALRKSIALTKEVSQNEFQVGRSHYVLGRLLLQTGRKEEGEKELKASQEARAQQPKTAKELQIPRSPGLDKKDMESISEQPPASAEETKKAENYENQLRPALADAYNNLGVAAAGHSDFAGALAYFQGAAQWNPNLATIDRNLGMAAFYANQFEQAIPPLARHLQSKPDDLRARAALGLSYYSTGKYRETLEALRPIEAQVGADPGLGYAYAVSMVKIGDYNQGVERLKAIETANPNSAEVHVLLGDAYADQKIYASALEEYRKAITLDPNQARTHFLAGLTLIYQGSPAEAVSELQTSLKLDPASSETRYHLAFALLQAQKKDEALPLLQEVIRQNPNNGDAFYQLGKLQLEQGQTQSAIASLESAVKLIPESDYPHYQLSLAYKRDSRDQDAAREMQLYQSLKSRRRGQEAPPSN